MKYWNDARPPIRMVNVATVEVNIVDVAFGSILFNPFFNR